MLDLQERKLQLLKAQYPTIETHLSTTEVVDELCVDADLIIGAVLLAGRRAPVVLKRSVVEQMNEGSVIVDLAAEMGGNCKLTEPDQVINRHGVTIIGYTDLPSTGVTTRVGADFDSFGFAYQYLWGGS